MTSGIGTVGITQSAPPAGAVVSGAITSASDTAKPLTKGNDTPISPRITVDPLAGVITEFLNGSGQVQAQIPSAAVVAYLRAGLDSNGQAKPQPDQVKPTSAVVA